MAHFRVYENAARNPARSGDPREANAYRLYVRNYSKFLATFLLIDRGAVDESDGPNSNCPPSFCRGRINSILQRMRNGVAINLTRRPCSCRSSNPRPSCSSRFNLNEASMAANRWEFSHFFTRTREPAAMMDDFVRASTVARSSMPIRSLRWKTVTSWVPSAVDALRGGGSQMLMLPLPSPLLNASLLASMVETQSPERDAAVPTSGGRWNEPFVRSPGEYFDVFVLPSRCDRDEWIWAMDRFSRRSSSIRALKSWTSIS